MSYLIKNEENNVLVNLPNGKVKNKGYRTNMSSQKGMTCLLSSIRKLSIFSEDYKSTQLYQALKKIKHELENYTNGKKALLTVISVCKKLNIDYEKVIKAHPKYQNNLHYFGDHIHWNCFPDKEKFFILYLHLIETAYHYLNIKELNWSPNHGAEGLMTSLRENGPLILVGKYGSCFRSNNCCVEMKHFNTEKRKVFGFKRNSFEGDDTSWTHAVIVDQIRIEDDNKYRVFFRDPNYDSNVGSLEYVFTLSYENFIKHLSCINRRGNGIQKSENIYALCSLTPKTLSDAPIKNFRNSLLQKWCLFASIIATITAAAYLLYNNDSGSLLRSIMPGAD